MKSVGVRSGVMVLMSTTVLALGACSASEDPGVAPDGAAGGFAGSLAAGGGAGEAPAGSGGASGSAPAGAGGAGAGGSAGKGAAGQLAAGSGARCPEQYTVATHVVLNVTWDGSLGIEEGKGQVHMWTKARFTETGSSATVEGISCGSLVPTITTTQIAGASKVLPEIPDAAWDKAEMPKFIGGATRSGNTLTVVPGPALLGLAMEDPNASWPAATAIEGIDHDGDMVPGVTSVPKQTDGFIAPPLNLLQSSRADKLYLAIRNVMTMSATFDGCPQSYTGTAKVTKFENHVIGCHVKDGGECTAKEAKFVDDNRTEFLPGTATFESKIVPANTTCTQVREALPVK